MSSKFDNDSNVKRSNPYTRGVQRPSDVKQRELDNIVESINGDVDDEEEINDSSTKNFDRVVNLLWKPRKLPCQHGQGRIRNKIERKISRLKAEIRAKRYRDDQLWRMLRRARW